MLIAGAGPLGWTCARLLARKKIRTLLVDPLLKHNSSPWTQKGLGIFWPSLNDPPTRAVVAHGRSMAGWLQEYCKHGQDLIGEFIPSSEIRQLNCFRAGILEHEIDELNKAMQQNLGLKNPQTFSKAKIFQESSPAFWLREKKNFDLPADEESFLSLQCGSVDSVSESKDHCLSKLSTGEILQSEMIILANGFEIAKLEPWLKDMLIPMTDIESHWISNFLCPQNAEPFALRASSGHVAALFFPHEDSTGLQTWAIRMTGPRFMLPSAGAGLQISDQKIDANLKDRIGQWLATFLLPALCEFLQSPEPAEIKLQIQDARYAIDCLPCDELPILGDLGHQGRILGSTGWLGCGWSASLQSARILSELIERGQSSMLAPLLRPRRWRSGFGEDGVTGMT